MDSRQMLIMKEWLETVIGENDNGPVSVKERIAYLVVCNGGYRASEESTNMAGKKIGPFTMGLSLAETVEHAYYNGMLAGMDVLRIDPYIVMDEFIEEYITKSLAEVSITIDASGIMDNGALNMKRLFDSYDHMNPEHGGDDN